MKTNQEMVRKMGTFNVIQRTKDGMFNATELLKQWNKNNGQQKQMVHYTDNASTKEFINALLIEESLKERNSVVMQPRRGKQWDNASTKVFIQARTEDGNIRNSEKLINQALSKTVVSKAKMEARKPAK